MAICSHAGQPGHLAGMLQKNVNQCQVGMQRCTRLWSAPPEQEAVALCYISRLTCGTMPPIFFLSMSVITSGLDMSCS